MADAQSIFNAQYKLYASTLKETSLDSHNGVNLCENESKTVYDFDKIVKDKYPKKQPASYDSLLIDNKTIYCIEFKNEEYADIDRKRVRNKLINGKEVLVEIFREHNIQIKNYTFNYCVIYKNSPTKWRRGILKNTVQFELKQYENEYFDKIVTNDINFFKNEFRKEFKEEGCL